MTSHILAIDIGLSGGLSNGFNEMSMPTKVIIDKPAYMVQKKDTKGKAIIFKSGPKKGQKQMVIKTKAKTHRELDVKTLQQWFANMEVIVIESQGTSFGNSAKTTRTTARNYGKLLAIAELSGAKVITVAPHKWKADLGLPAEKEATAEFLRIKLGKSFIGEKGGLNDGPMDACAIHYWYMNIKLKES